MKKILLCISILVALLFVTACNKTDNNLESPNEYEAYTLMFNMPLSFDDLDKFEALLLEDLEKDDIGEIVGDGSPIGEYGPKSTDIEIDVRKNKIAEFKKILTKYKFPEKSNINIDGKIVSEFGSLQGIRLIISDIDIDESTKIYDDLCKNLDGKYDYITIIDYLDKKIIYVYGDSLEDIFNDTKNYIDDNSLRDNTKLTKMNDQ